MAEFPFVTPELAAHGPVVTIEVRVPLAKARVLLQRGMMVPAPVVVTAMIDTGATWCSLTPDVFERLALSPFDEASIATADGRQGVRDLYDVDLEFISERTRHHVQHVNAISSTLSGCAVEGLIGRNVLSCAVFWYDGRRNQYSLEF